MPELPEVENVRRGLKRLLSPGSVSRQMTLCRKDLRFPFPAKLTEKIAGQKLIDIHRRAKFLIFETEKYWLLSHLGMTGSWRELREHIVHDHLIWEFESGRTLVFNDPRRFGYISLFEKSRVPIVLPDLGPEPLEGEFTAKYLFEISRRKTQPIKNFLLNQKNVAGLGNIYVCEALYQARISPKWRAGRLTMEQSERLIPAIQKTLEKAIQAGGSTIRDYVNAEGRPGGFQNLFRVYGRDGEVCRTCKTTIRTMRQAGRSTFWCPQCQK